MSVVEVLLSNWNFPIYTTHSCPENRLYCTCFLWVFRECSKMLEEYLWRNHLLVHWIYTFYSFVVNSINWIGMFREVPVLLSRVGTLLENERQYKFLEICLKNFGKLLGKSPYLSKLQAFKLQPSVLNVFKIQKIYKITSAVAFFFCRSRCYPAGMDPFQIHLWEVSYSVSDTSEKGLICKSLIRLPGDWLKTSPQRRLCDLSGFLRGVFELHLRL